MTDDVKDGNETTDLVVYEIIEPHIARITLNRPERRNAMLTPEMNDQLLTAVLAAEDDDAVKVVILTGAGAHFCSGEDVSRTPVDSYAQTPGGRIPQSVRIRGMSRYAGRDPLFADKTLVAAVRGAALGLGFKLALSCDLIVAAEGATFGRPQSRIGLAGFDMFLPVLLLRLGINRGYEALLTGRTITAEELREWGVVSSLVPAADLDDEALRYARAVANHSTDGLMLGRQAMHMFWSMMGMQQWQQFCNVAHPLFTNLVWRDDEANLFRERKSAANMRDALKSVYARWDDLGFE